MLSLLQKEVLVILCWNPWQLFLVSETRYVFSPNYAVQFCRITHLSQTIVNAIDLFFFDSFFQKNRKRINNGFGIKNRNRKYSIVLKQSICNPWSRRWLSWLEHLPSSTQVLRRSWVQIRLLSTDCWALGPQVCSDLPTNWEQYWRRIWQPCPKGTYISQSTDRDRHAVLNLNFK